MSKRSKRTLPEGWPRNVKPPTLKEIEQVVREAEEKLDKELDEIHRLQNLSKRPNFLIYA